MNPNFSIIVPTLDNFAEFLELVSAINLQTLPPKEIVVADSSSSDKIETSIQNLSSSIPLVYVRVGRAYKYDRFLHRIFSLPFLSRYKEKFPTGRAFPYEATNAGAAAASFEWLAFLEDGVDSPILSPKQNENINNDLMSCQSQNTGINKTIIEGLEKIDSNNSNDSNTYTVTPSELYISTKTKIVYLNNTIDLNSTFWKIPVMHYGMRKNGVIKKQIKLQTFTKE